MKKRLLLVASLASFALMSSAKVKFDFSVVFVPEEGGVKFEKITDDADCVADYEGRLVMNPKAIFGASKTSILDWWIAPQIGLSPDGTKIGSSAFLVGRIGFSLT